MKLVAVSQLLIKTSIVLASVAALAACSTAGSTGAGSTNAMGAAGVANNGAKTYGLANQAGYQAANGQTNASGQVINPMTAPSNQTYYFAFDKSTMRPQDRKALDIQANYLASHASAHILLAGNTDNRGSREYNIALGWRRDQSVARLLEQQGVQPQQIQMLSYGKERPAVLGNNERAWSLNRRVNLTYKAQ